MKRLIYWVIPTVLLFGCGDPSESVQSQKVEKILPVILNEEDVFDGTKVLSFLRNEVKHVQEANTLFLKGLNAFRNDKNIDSADYYFRASLLKEPTAKAYYELGNLYMENSNFDRALLSYDLAEKLNYEPFSKILYNKSCLYSLQKKSELSGQYLEYAIQAGYNNLDHIGKDSDLSNLRKSHYYSQAINKGLRGVSNSENLFWLQFKKIFTKPQLPQKLLPHIAANENEALTYISYEFERFIAEMRDEEFSREVSKGFLQYSIPYETEKFVAIVYVVRDEFMGEFAPLLYRMATFTHEGILIDKKEVAGREYLDKPLMESVLNEDMSIDIHILEPTYEKDPSDKGYYDNPIISTQKIGERRLRLTDNGKIVEVPTDDLTDVEP